MASRTITVYEQAHGNLWLKVPACIAAWLGKPVRNGQQLVDMALADYIWRYELGPEDGQLPEGWFLHHIDHNPVNHDIRNLQPISRALHGAHHRGYEECSYLASPPETYMALRRVLDGARQTRDWDNNPFHLREWEEDEES